VADAIHFLLFKKVSELTGLCLFVGTIDSQVFQQYQT